MKSQAAIGAPMPRTLLWVSSPLLAMCLWGCSMSGPAPQLSPQFSYLNDPAACATIALYRHRTTHEPSQTQLCDSARFRARPVKGSVQQPLAPSDEQLLAPSVEQLLEPSDELSER